MSKGTEVEPSLKKLGSEVPKHLSKDAGKTAIDLEVDKQVVVSACLQIGLDSDALTETVESHLEDYYNAEQQD